MGKMTPLREAAALLHVHPSTLKRIASDIGLRLVQISPRKILVDEDNLRDCVSRRARTQSERRA